MHYENSPWPRTGEAPGPRSARVRLENGHEPDHELAHGLRHVYFLNVLFFFSAAKQRCEIHHMPGTISTSRSRQIRPRHEHISSSEEPRIQPLRTLTTKTIWTGDFRIAKYRCRTAYKLECVLRFVEARSELVCSFDHRSLRITTLSYVRQFASENKHDAGAESYAGGD